MKRWKKYALCFTCVCCIGMLTGCGSRNKNAQMETENTTETNRITEENRVNDVQDEIIEDDGAANGGMADGDGTGGTVTEDIRENDAVTESDQLVNDVTDKPEDMTGSDLGDAGADLMEGIGDAGADLVDGVENAGDELTGNAQQTDTGNDQ